jgi:hypothetical protein
MLLNIKLHIRKVSIGYQAVPETIDEANQVSCRGIFVTSGPLNY